MLATFKRCQEIREGVGEEGDFICDFHGKLDMADAVTLATMLEPLRPYFGRGPGSQRGPSPVSNHTGKGQSAAGHG